MLMDIANAVSGTSLDLHVSIYVTCLCNPEAVTPIPNSEVSIYRPSVGKLLRELVTPPESTSSSASEKAEAEVKASPAAKLEWVGTGGGVGVCASGPEALCRETQNAVAKLGLTRGIPLGGIGLHTELFAM